MSQRFYASPSDTFTWPNGAVGHRSQPLPFDTLGPYAKVRNCPIDGVPGLRLACYATGHADTFFSIPACTRHKGKYIKGFFTTRNDGVVFVPMDAHRERLVKPEPKEA